MGNFITKTCFKDETDYNVQNLPRGDKFEKYLKEKQKIIEKELAKGSLTMEQLLENLGDHPNSNATPIAIYFLVEKLHRVKITESPVMKYVNGDWIKTTDIYFELIKRKKI